VRVVGRDLRGQRGQLRLEDGLDHRVLVLGVRNEQVDDALHVPGQVGTPGPVVRVGGAGRGGDREQLGSDPLVDVAVRVERHALERPQDTLLDDGHGVAPLSRAAPGEHAWFVLRS
jgi:hypothetical protein